MNVDMMPNYVNIALGYFIFFQMKSSNEKKIVFLTRMKKLIAFFVLLLALTWNLQEAHAKEKVAQGYISQDPIGLEGNNPNLYAYVSDSNSWIDPFGLDPFGPNQDVYALFNKADVVNGVPVEGAKPYYVGISQNSDVRLGQHTNSGRFNPATDVKVDLHKDIDYAKARALEQHNIEKFDTIDKSNPKANQQNSFRHSRTDDRGKAFKKEYKKIKCG